MKTKSVVRPSAIHKANLKAAAERVVLGAICVTVAMIFLFAG
jgi:hypothetical protein